MKKDKSFKLPPPEFSNAMNCLDAGWDFSEWETSKEWRLFCAGREAEARRVANDAKQAAEKHGKIARGQWY